MAKVIAKLGIKRDSNHMYFIKGGAVWAVPRKRPGVKAKGRKTKVAEIPVALDYSKSLYYIDGKGNVASSPRKRKAAKKTAKKK